MMHWNKTIAVEDLQSLSRQTAAEHCGIEFTQIGDGWVEATIPLDARTRDIQGTLHPGAFGILGETIGMCLDRICEQFTDCDALISRHQGLRYTYGN